MLKFLAINSACVLIVLHSIVSCSAPSATEAPKASAASPPPAPANRWAAITAEINASPLNDVRVIVGDMSGQVFSYEKGYLPETQRYQIASASKMMVGVAVFRLIERGVMSLDDKPHRYFSWWTSDPADPRSRITLEQLLSLVSGFNARPISGNCMHHATATMEECVRAIYEDGLDSLPGEEFRYGPEHLDIAAHMAEVATGKKFSDIFDDEIVRPLGLSANTSMNAPDPANANGETGAYSTARDYARFLDALFRGAIIQDIAGFTRDRTDSVIFGYRPNERHARVGDWHYSLASWRECDLSYFSGPCVVSVTLSSPGAFGWTPWIDFEDRYYAVIAHEDPNILDASNSLSAALELEQRLQPLIRDALRP